MKTLSVTRASVAFATALLIGGTSLSARNVSAAATCPALEPSGRIGEVVEAAGAPFPQRRRSRRVAVSRLIPVGTQLKVRLKNSISSKKASVGDRFTAAVINPSRYEGANLAGHVARLKESGRVKGHTEMVLAFDSVTLAGGKQGPLHGQVLRIYDSESVRTVDEEGHIESAGRGKQTLKRSGIGAVAGAVIGGLAGGGKGAAIGTIVGGAAGAGSIAITGGKELKLEPGTEMLVKVTSK